MCRSFVLLGRMPMWETRLAINPEGVEGLIRQEVHRDCLRRNQRSRGSGMAAAFIPGNSVPAGLSARSWITREVARGRSFRRLAARRGGVA